MGAMLSVFYGLAAYALFFFTHQDTPMDLTAVADGFVAVMQLLSAGLLLAGAVLWIREGLLSNGEPAPSPIPTDHTSPSPKNELQNRHLAADT